MQGRLTAGSGEAQGGKCKQGACARKACFLSRSHAMWKPRAGPGGSGDRGKGMDNVAARPACAVGWAVVRAGHAGQGNV